MVDRRVVQSRKLNHSRPSGEKATAFQRFKEQATPGRPPHAAMDLASQNTGGFNDRHGDSSERPDTEKNVTSLSRAAWSDRAAFTLTTPPRFPRYALAQTLH